TPDEPFEAEVEVAHLGAEPMANAKVVWRIGSADKPLAQGTWGPRPIAIGKNISLGRIAVDLAHFGTGEYKLVVTVAPASFFNPVNDNIQPGTDVVRGVTYFENEWTFWIFPTARAGEAEIQMVGSAKCPLSRNPEVLLTSNWEEAEKRLAAGGRVLFVPRNT